MRSLGARLLFISMVIVASCDKPSHDNIEKWRATERGPSKLEDALKDGSLDADLRAHAAQVLVAIDRGEVVDKALAQMAQEPRAAVIAKLAPRLWNDAKPQNEMEQPTRKKIAAKDALFSIRGLATAKAQAEIDGYLVEWLAGFYEMRAGLGLHHGEKIVRAIGARAGQKLVAAGKAIIARPEQDGKIVVFADELLKGIALTGSPDSVDFLAGLGESSKHPDETVQVRAMGALYYAYVTYENPADPAALRGVIDRLLAMASSDDQEAENVNVAAELIARAGKPHCIPPLAKLAQHKDEARQWMGVQLGIKCAGVDGVVAMAEALPRDRAYARGILEKYFWEYVVALGPSSAAPARTLLGSGSWVARVTGLELLVRVGGKADAEAARKLAKDPAKLKGWWGKAGKGPQGQKGDPTLGWVATGVAEILEKKP